MNTTIRKCLLIAAVTAIALPLYAQNIRTVTRTRILPGRAGDFQAAVKDYNAVLKKAGWDQASTVWLSQSGPREYALVRYMSKYADLDANPAQDPKLKEYAGQLSAIAARRIACVENSDRVIDEILPDLSVRSNDIQPLARVMRSVIKPDRVNDYMELVKSTVYPAAQKAGMKSYLFSRTRYGGPSSEFRSVTGLDNWAALDGMSPIRKAIGEEGWASFQKKVTGMTVETEVNVYRFQPDLSYLPPARTSSR